jgi:hypothetical protein
MPVRRAITNQVSIGRIVVHREYQSGGTYIDSAAIVNRVLDDGLVELTVFTPGGPVVKPRVSQAREAPMPGHWHWPVML